MQSLAGAFRGSDYLHRPDARCRSGIGSDAGGAIQLIGAPITFAYLIIEVSESSLRMDTKVKAPLYAEAKIPAYWIVDRPHGVVHLLTEPVEGRYTKVERRGPGELLTCDSLPGFSFAIDELFAP